MKTNKLIVALAASIFLAGCGNDSTPVEDQDSANTAEVTEEATTPETEADNEVEEEAEVNDKQVDEEESEEAEDKEVEAEAQTGELNFTAGTYKAEAGGYNGPLEVEVTFYDTKITDINIVTNTETDHVGTPALPVAVEDMIAANGSGVDNISGATVSVAALKAAVNKAAEEANVSDLDQFKKNSVDHPAGEDIEQTYDIIVVGGGGAGITAATEAAMAGNTVAIVEKNIEVGGNTLVSGGQYQSVMPYLVWDREDPDATTGEYNGETYEKVKSDMGRINTLETIYNWSEEAFDTSLDADEEFKIGDIEELSKRGVDEEYLPILQTLKDDIQAYLAWAKPQLEEGKLETELTLFSTPELHMFQTYYGGIRPNLERDEWVYGDKEIVENMINEAQDIKPFLNELGSQFDDSTQRTLIGGLWQRQNQWIGAEVDGEFEESRWATYFAAPIARFEAENEANTIYKRTAAESLIEEDGRVTGVEASMYDGTKVSLRANKGVILATGGYAANVEKVLETNDYWKPEYLEGRLGTTNRNSLQGDGIDMAESVGATTTGEGFTQLMPLGWIQGGNLAFGGGESAIYLNPQTGKRYVDESAERDVLSLAAFENGIEINGVKGVYIEVANVDTPIPGPYPYDKEDVDMRQYIRDLDGAAELFKELDIDISKETLEETIRSYDEYLMGVRDDIEIPKDGYRDLIGIAEKDQEGRFIPDTYEIGELRIRFLAPSTHHTMGGLKVDIGRRVLDEDDNPIPGLYAAGEVTGGIHGGNRLGGNAITEIIASGRIAARSVEEDNK